MAGLAAVVAAGSLAWAGSAVASGSGGGGVWFTDVQQAGMQAGGSANDVGYSIAMTSDDTPIITGSFSGTAVFPTGPGTSISLTSAGGDDIFVAALNADDTYFAWAVAAGGVGDEPYQGLSIAITADDTPIITGDFEGTAYFPTGRPAPDDSIALTASGTYDMFVAALNPGDSTFAWAVAVGGSSESWGYSVAVTGDDTPVITGSFNGTVSFPTGPAADDSIILTSAGGYDMFVAALNADDSYFAWAVSAGGSGSDYGYGIAITADDTPIVSGSFAGTAFFPTAPDDSIALTAFGVADIFVAALNADDSYFAWAVAVAGTPGDPDNFSYGQSIAVSEEGTPIITGSFAETASFPTGPGTSISLTSAGSNDIFVAALNADDSYFAWAVAAGGAGFDYGYSIALTSDDTPVVTGYFSNTASFPTGPAPDDSIVLTSAGNDDIFVAALNADDSYFAWAVAAGGTGFDQGRSVALTSDDTPVVTGYFRNTASFPTGPSTSLSLTTAGNNDDVFVAWLGPFVAPPAPPAPTISSVTPATGTVAGGTSVTITGTDLTGATAVTFGGVAATITSNTAMQIVATSPAGAAGAVAVAVTTAGGTATSANAFTYTTSPDPDPTPPVVIPPSAPRTVTGEAGNASAVISWQAPLISGSFPVSMYQAEVSPGGQSCLVSALSTNCTITGLTNGTTYTATVRALNGAGWGAFSAASPQFTPRANDASIVITGTRGEVRGRSGIVVTGTTSEFEQGAILRPWVRFPGQASYVEGTARILVDDDGAFTWQRRTGKKTYVVIKTPDGGVKSNRVIISARR